MKSSIFQKILQLLFVFYIILYSSCTSQKDAQETNEDYSTVKVYEEKTENPQKRNKNKLEGLLIKKADSFYFVKDFKQAQTLYDMALNNVTDAETKKYLLQKIADIRENIEENTTNDSIKNRN
ncbi:hypothetical protein WAF17_19590 [Bernardetia sp. ABR2-2B]|uniref:hypothetical protein n=1 Tax=Bernardetia sp. ABR2-2B TaxID=3127472 RepID=UPI0030D0A074